MSSSLLILCQAPRQRCLQNATSRPHSHVVWDPPVSDWWHCPEPLSSSSLHHPEVSESQWWPVWTVWFWHHTGCPWSHWTGEKKVTGMLQWQHTIYTVLWNCAIWIALNTVWNIGCITYKADKLPLSKSRPWRLQERFGKMHLSLACSKTHNTVQYMRNEHVPNQLFVFPSGVC